MAKLCQGITLKGKSCCRKLRQGSHCFAHKIKWQEEKPEECPVCLEQLEKIDFPLECGHWVHRDCIIKSGKSECPMCRRNIKLTIEEQEKIQEKYDELNTITIRFAINDISELSIDEQVMLLLEAMQFIED